MNQSILLERKPTIVVFSNGYGNDACSFIRIIGPMLAANWNVIWAAEREIAENSFNLNIASQADVIIIQRNFPSASTEKALFFLTELGIPIVYDLDDMFLGIPTYHPSYDVLKKHIPYIKWILKEADIITVSTIPLKKSLSKYTSRPIHVKPNIVDFDLFFSPPKSHSTEFNFLISGTPTHRRDWSILDEPITEILKIKGGNVNFVFFGEAPKRFSNHPSVKIIDFQPDYKQYALRLKKLDVHAALIPLEDTKFNHCKSNIKWLEYSAAGIPGAYSDIAPYSSSIYHGKNGLLVKNTPISWFNAMNQLLTGHEITANLIQNAQHEVRERYSIEHSLDEFKSIFIDLFGQKHSQKILSDLPIVPSRLKTNMMRVLDKHILWRLNKNR